MLRPRVPLIPVPEVRPRLGVGSTFAASAAADEIRQEIGEISGADKLPTNLTRWSYFSRRNLESIQALREAKRVQWLLTDLVIGLLSVLLIAGWLTSSTLRERRKARRAEKELGTTQQNYQLLTEQAADGVFLAGENGKFLLVNSRMCEMLGYSDAEMYRQHLLTFFCGLGVTRSASTHKYLIPNDLNMKAVVLRHEQTLAFRSIL